MMLSLCRKSLLHLSIVCLCMSCSSKGNDEDVSGGNGLRTPEDPVVFVNANLVFYGTTNDVTTSNHYSLSLYTNMVIDELSNPIGPGKLLRLSINAELFGPENTDLSLREGFFAGASSSYDFTPGTFNDGFIYQIDLPGEGKIDVPDGSFYGEVPAGVTEFTPDLLDSGAFTVTRNGDNYTITGTMTGSECLKRRFVYTGKLPVIDRSDKPEQLPNTNLTADVNFTPAKARLQDKEDFYYLGDQSMRVLEVYLASSELNLTPLWPEGSGESLKIEFFVSWDTDVTAGIPAGTYTVVPQVPGGGIRRTDLVPGGIAPGYPDRFTYPDGTWYQTFVDGKMSRYGRVEGGSMTVTRDGDAHQITFDLLDCDKSTQHHIKGSYSQQTPITIYK